MNMTTCQNIQLLRASQGKGEASRTGIWLRRVNCQLPGVLDWKQMGNFVEWAPASQT
jgi:hypothetical protein